MATVTVEYFGVSGTGKTVKEAKQNAGNKIETCVNRSPIIFAYRGCSVVVSFRPDHAQYTLTHADSDGEIISCCICLADDVEESAIRHLLQVARTIGEYDVPSWVPRSMHARLIDDWKRDDSFQLAYRHAETLPCEQLPAGGPHSWACEHQREFAIA